MDIKRILKFLKDLSANNNRPWFNEHKDEYTAVRADFEDGVAKAIARIATFDPSVAHITVKDSTYRFYRDTRFSADKSPYKRHLGAYIAAHGKKALHGGYYIHIEPGHCLVSCGNYWLPTNILTSCRNEIMGNIDEWLKCVENDTFLSFRTPGMRRLGLSKRIRTGTSEDLSVWFPARLRAHRISSYEGFLLLESRARYLLRGRPVARRDSEDIQGRQADDGFHQQCYRRL